MSQPGTSTAESVLNSYIRFYNTLIGLFQLSLIPLYSVSIHILEQTIYSWVLKNLTSDLWISNSMIIVYFLGFTYIPGLYQVGQANHS